MPLRDLKVDAKSIPYQRLRSFILSLESSVFVFLRKLPELSRIVKYSLNLAYFEFCIINLFPVEQGFNNILLPINYVKGVNNHFFKITQSLSIARTSLSLETIWAKRNCLGFYQWHSDARLKCIRKRRAFWAEFVLAMEFEETGERRHEVLFSLRAALHWNVNLELDTRIFR